jgi:hypothetical protein
MRKERKNSFVETLSNSSAAFNIIVFALSELMAAFVAILQLLAPWRSAGSSGRNGAYDDQNPRLTYRSAEIERRRTGISDRRRQASLSSSFFATAVERERRNKPDRRATPWDLHPA